LDVIRDLLGMVDRPDQPCASVDQLARAQMAEVDAKIADLTRLRAELAHVANQCHGGTVRECRIVEALSGGEGETAAPATSPTPSHLGALTLLVRDYDEAIGWYRDKLGFNLLEDTDLGGGKRWVRMAPRGDNATCLLLARAVGPVQEAAIGNQAGGRVFLFLHTDDFTRDHAAMLAAGVHFLEEPRHESYASVAVFQDIYGNKWDLLQRR
jgi:catechol 2,3-dioxygenase-like lactoylglutathione lyase family enzyme